MISDMLRTSRWFYVQEPLWPPGPRGHNSWYRKRALYAEIIAVVKESPGISTGEVARKLGRPYEYISPLLFHLKRFSSLRYEPVGVERTDGLAVFAGVPCVRQMLSKLSSEKTKGPWLRRLFRYLGKRTKEEMPMRIMLSFVVFRHPLGEDSRGRAAWGNRSSLPP